MATLSKKRLYDLTEISNGGRSYVPTWWYVDSNGKKVRKAKADDPDHIVEAKAKKVTEDPKPEEKSASRGRKKKSDNAE